MYLEKKNIKPIKTRLGKQPRRGGASWNPHTKLGTYNNASTKQQTYIATHGSNHNKKNATSDIWCCIIYIYIYIYIMML